MSINGYLQIKGIQGESANARHENEIEISDVAWAMSRQERGRAQPSGFSFTKRLDASSPRLAEAAHTGTVFEDVTFSVEAVAATTGAAIDYLVITLTNATIVSYHLGTGDQQIEENLVLSAQALEMTYNRASSTGAPSGSETVSLRF